MTHKTTNRSALLAGLVLAVTLATAPVTRAANQTWQGDVDNNWSTLGNWSGGALPGTADTAFFNDTATTTTPTFTASTTIGTIDITGSTAFMFSHSSGVTYLANANAFTSASSANQTFGSSNYRGFRIGDSTFTNSGAGLVDFNVDILKEDDFNGGTNGDTGRLVFTGTGDFEVQRVGKRAGHLVSGLVKSGTGTLTVVGAFSSFATTGTNVEGLTSTVTINSGGGTLRIRHTDALGTGNITIAKTSTSTGTLELALTGTNTFDNTFNGFNSSTGLVGGGTANILNTSGINTITSDLTITGTGGNGLNVVSNGGHLNLAGIITTTVDNSRRLDLGGTGTGEISGSITNGGGGQVFAVEKRGSGTWTISDASTYTGSTNVAEGTLLVTGSLGNTAVNVTGGTLGGDGSIAGNVFVNANGKLAPGTSAGTLSLGGNLSIFNAVNAANSQSMLFELGPIASSDKVVLSSGTLFIGAGVLNFDDFDFSALLGLTEGVYTLIQTASTISGTLGSNLTGDVAPGWNGTLSLADGNTDLVLTVFAPAPAALPAGLALMALATARRRPRNR